MSSVIRFTCFPSSVLRAPWFSRCHVCSQDCTVGVQSSVPGINFLLVAGCFSGLFNLTLFVFSTTKGHNFENFITQHLQSISFFYDRVCENKIIYNNNHAAKPFSFLFEHHEKAFLSSRISQGEAVRRYRQAQRRLINGEPILWRYCQSYHSAHLSLSIDL